MRDSGRMPDFVRKTRLQSYAWLYSHFLTPVDVTTLVVSPDSKWLQHLTAQTLSRKQTGRDNWLVPCSKSRHLKASHVQESGQVLRDQRTLTPAWSERNPSIQKDSVPLVTWCWRFVCNSTSAWNCQCSTSPGVFFRYRIYIFPRDEGSLSCLRLTQIVIQMSTTRLYRGYVNWG
jgi:hypothetical protein